MSVHYINVQKDIVYYVLVQKVKGKFVRREHGVKNLHVMIVMTQCLKDAVVDVLCAIGSI